MDIRLSFMPERPIDENEGAVAGRPVDLVRNAVAAAMLATRRPAFEGSKRDGS